MSVTVNDTVQEVAQAVCVNHPQTETLLRCNRCGQPVCFKCLEQTPVGYRCKACIRGQQNIYFNAKRRDYAAALLVSTLIGAVATPLAGLLLAPFFLLGFFLALMVGPTAGGLFVQLVRTSVRRRRGRYLRHAMVAGALLGAMLGLAAAWIALGFWLWMELALWVFVVSTVTTAYRLLR